MSTQLQLFDVPVSVSERKAWDPKTDMWGQPSKCEECGAANHRSGAYVHCLNGHPQPMECPGREDHPLYEQFCRYRRSIGHPID